MSAKGRKSKTGEVAEKPDHEFYPTPAWCVTRLLQHVELPGGDWLEPSAGDGAIIRATTAKRTDINWTAVELRPDARLALQDVVLAEQEYSRGPRETERVIIGDFLRIWTGRDEPFAVALGNPPFSLAAQFVQRALTGAEQVVMLLRLNFLGSSNDRRALFEEAGMPDVYVLPERPSFTGGGTDACEYAWMRWIRGKRQKSEVRILFENQQALMFGETP